MGLLHETNTIIGIIVGLIAIGGFISGLFLRLRRKHQQQKIVPTEESKAIDVERLGVKRSFYLPFSADNVIAKIAGVLEPDSLLLYQERSGNDMGDFVKATTHYLQKRKPKRYNELKKQNLDTYEFVAEVRKEARFRATTPTELKVRIVSEFYNETYCEAECYPEL